MADSDVTKIPVASAAPLPVNSGASNDANAADPFEDIKRELATRFELLPDDLKKVITDDKYQVQLFEIGKANQLNFEELGTLEMETTMVLLGMVRPADYRDEIQIQLKKNDAEIDTLVAQVNERIFTPIRGALEKLYANKKDPEDYLTGDALNGTPPIQKPAFSPEMDVKTSPSGVAANPTGVPSPSSFPIAKPIISSIPTPAPTPVPAPSMMNVPKPSPVLTTSEKSLLEKTGVVISDTPTPTPSAPISSRNDLLAGIENPTKTTSSGIVADKLKTAMPVMPATKTTDYTIAKAPTTPTPTPVAPKAAGGPDPYREPIN